MTEHGPSSRILKPGRNCWRIAASRRAAFLIDAAAYFAALRAALAQAQRSIFIIGWDVDSRTLLCPEPARDGWPAPLGPFLKALAQARPELEIHVLNWDFIMLYAAEREALPLYTLGWQAHRNLHFELDGQHPAGACHHQKIVVIDDAAAFVGGMDLAQTRWDTPEHAPRAPARVHTNGNHYPPVHDVQMLVDGPAAQALGELARERWQRATGARPPGPALADAEIWPTGLEPDVTSVEVGIARTAPRYGNQPPITEVRQLYLDAIAAARDSLYFENQYLTASSIGEALEARLRAPDGPETVVVSRLTGGGWLEENTMEILRARWLRRLRAADAAGRLRVYYPDCAGYVGECLNVHAKLMVMDDRLLRIGSSNLANRSMGLDTECDLVIESHEPRVRQAIARFRHRLLAEHLDTTPERIEAAAQHTGSLIGAIESLNTGPWRCLRPLSGEVSPEADANLPSAAVIDPETPIDADRLMDELLPSEHRPAARRRLVYAVGLLAVACALSWAWNWGPLAGWLNQDNFAAIGQRVRAAPATPLWVLGAYLFAALTAMPITLVILATGLVFGPVSGFCYAVSGSLLGAAATFGLGHLAGRDVVRRLAGQRLNALSRWLRHKGLLAMIAVRLVPVAPFTVVNLVAGASRVRFRDFLLGTAFGMAPGAAAITLFSGRLASALAQPDALNLGLLGGAAMAIGSGAFLLHRWLRRRGPAA